MKQFFEDKEGKLSIIRLQSFLTLLYGFFIATYEVALNKPLNYEFLVLIFVCAFAPKLVQKYAEKKK